MKKVIVGTTERGILYHDKQFVRIVGPGVYRSLGLFREVTLEVVDVVKFPELKGTIKEYLVANYSPILANQLEKIVTGPREVAIVSLNGRSHDIVGPNEQRLYWKGLAKIEVQQWSIASDFEVAPEVIRDLSDLDSEDEVLTVIVPEQSRGLLMEAGVIVRELGPGKYGFWKALRKVSAMVFDTRLTALEVSGQEMLTKDKVSLRLNLTVGYRLEDVAKAVRAVGDVHSEIYSAAQLLLRQAVGEKTLDQLLEQKELLNRDLAAELRASMALLGVAVMRVGVKDIILPGEMRTLFNQVVEAEKAAEANNIRRREETAATRSLLNTAKMMENNPTLLRLKELETVERISEKVENLTVFDGMKGVVNGLVSLTGR